MVKIVGPHRHLEPNAPMSYYLFFTEIDIITKLIFDVGR